MAPEIELSITKGKTFEFAFLYAEDELLYLPITAMTNKAPCRLAISGHGLPDGWPVQVQCVKAPSELNSADGEHYFATVVNADTVELNTVNAHCWKAFAGSGLLVCRKPANLAGWKARAQVRDRVGGEVLFSWHSDPAETPDGVIEVDEAASAFVFHIDATTTTSLAWKRGVYDAEIIAPTGEVYPLTAISSVKVESEVTV